MKDRTIEERIERSSLGSQAAAAARRTVTTADATRVVARAATARATQKSGRNSRLGGNRHGGTYI